MRIIPVFVFAAFCSGFLLLFSAVQAQTQGVLRQEIDQFRNRIWLNWKPPRGSQAIEMRIRLKPDGTLVEPPTILTRGTGPRFVAARDAAARAVLRSVPFVFRRENYSVWRDMEIVLDPTDPQLACGPGDRWLFARDYCARRSRSQ